ncbi:hypothetical protein EVA_06424 [gut metagenome]|uniref:Uncharacterized protein n=1 Tax=gut metagenome TaxID=749906 RepID=J9GEY8_9ZZZZ
MAPGRTPGWCEGQGEHDGTEYHHDGHEDALCHQYAVIGHLEYQFPDKADNIIDPFADFGLCGNGCPLGIVVDGIAQILYIVDELIPPGGILTDSGYLLGCCDGVLNTAESVQILALLLSHLEFEGGHFLVLGFGHGLGSGFQSFAGNLQGLTNPRGRRDTDGNADDAQKFHHVHPSPSEHHHPAFVRTYTECKQQTQDACQSDGISQYGHIWKGFHGDQQFVQALVYGRQSDG